MKPLSETDPLEKHILDLFQVNKITGFTEDFKTSLISPLTLYFGESDPELAQMSLGGENLVEVCNKFSTYRAYLESSASKRSKSQFLERNGITNDGVIQALLEILSPYSVQDFEKDFSVIKQEVLKEVPNKERVTGLLGSFSIKYFPQPRDITQEGALEVETIEFREDVLSRIRSLLED